MAGQQVTAPQDEAHTETEKGRGPQRTFRLGLPAGHVHPGQPDGRQHREGPAEGDAHLGPPGAPGVVLVAPVAVVLALRDVFRPRVAGIDPEVARIEPQAQRPVPRLRVAVTGVRDGRGAGRHGAGREVGAVGAGHPLVPIMRVANHNRLNPMITPTKPSATGPKKSEAETAGVGRVVQVLHVVGDGRHLLVAHLAGAEHRHGPRADPDGLRHLRQVGVAQAGHHVAFGEDAARPGWRGGTGRS